MLWISLCNPHNLLKKFLVRILGGRHTNRSNVLVCTEPSSITSCTEEQSCDKQEMRMGMNQVFLPETDIQKRSPLLYGYHFGTSVVSVQCSEFYFGFSF